MTRTYWEMLIKTTYYAAWLHFPSVVSHKHNIIGCVVAGNTVDRYSLRNMRTDIFLMTATCDRTIKVVLSFSKAHNTAGGQQQQDALAKYRGFILDVRRKYSIRLSQFVQKINIYVFQDFFQHQLLLIDNNINILNIIIILD